MLFVSSGKPKAPTNAATTSAADPHQDRRRNLALLFGANSVSGFAQGITMISIPWYFMTQVGGAQGKTLVATSAAIATLICIFWGLYAGTLVDRYNRKRVFLLTNLGGLALLMGATGWAWMLGPGATPMHVAMCCTVFLGSGLVFTIHYPNLYAFVQELFEPSQYGRVNSAIEIQGQLTNMLGMMVGSVLIAGTSEYNWLPGLMQFGPWSLGAIFALNALTYAIALVLIAFIRYIPKPRTAARESVGQQLRTGIHHLRADVPLLVFGICSHMAFFAIMMIYQTLMPMYVHDVLHETGGVLGLAESTFAVGALTAGILAAMQARFIRRMNKIKLIIALLFGVSILAAVLVAWPYTPVLLVASALFGLFNSTVRIQRLTYLLNVVPNALMGRVTSSLQVVNMALRFGFGLVFVLPFFADNHTGAPIRVGLGLVGGTVLFSALLMMSFYRRFRQ